MAEIKISQLSESTQIHDNDVIPIVDTGANATKKTKLDSLKSYVLGGVDLSNYYTKTESNNLLNAKENTSNKTQTISSSSTNNQYPTAKAVYDYISSLDAREVSY